MIFALLAAAIISAGCAGEVKDPVKDKETVNSAAQMVMDAAEEAAGITDEKAADIAREVISLGLENIESIEPEGKNDMDEQVFKVTTADGGIYRITVGQHGAVTRVTDGNGKIILETK